MTSNLVEIRVGGKRYGGWKSVLITSSIEQVARAFALEVTESFPGNTDFRSLQTGELVQVFIGSDLVCTGYITSTPISYDGKSVNVQVQGKSRTVDLVDCCPPSAAYKAASESTTWTEVKGKSGKKTTTSTGSKPQTSWKNLPAGRIIEELAKPYGITLTASSYGREIKTHTVSPGETVFESIKRLITKDNLVLTDDENGNLVLTEPGLSGVATDRLVLGSNILQAKADFNAATRFSTYVTLGQHSGTDTDFGRTASEDKGVATDAEVSRFRLKVLKDSGQGSNVSALDRAQFEARYQAARFQAGTYTVQGWRQSDGSLWKPNIKVVINDPVTARFNQEMLIVGARLRLSAAGMTSELDVMPPEGYKRDGAKTDTKQETTPWQNVK
nr:MAG TPA: 43 kDa tail protein [Caudoviricetes sp.]